MNVAGLPQLPPAGIYDTFLVTTYKPLVGQIFSATYKERRLMPQTNNLRDILVVEAQNPFAERLNDVRRSVLAMCGETVWKGITLAPMRRPESIGCDVCLWVEPTLDGLSEGSTLWFKIEETTVFPCFPRTGFPHGGVSINVSPLTPQIPSTVPVIQMGTGLIPHGGVSITAKGPLTPQIPSTIPVIQMSTGIIPYGGVTTVKAHLPTPQIPSTIRVTQMGTQTFPTGR